VATCGRPLALSRCLDAIAAQTRLPDELIVIDQNPSSAARDVARRSKIIVDYRKQPKLGLSASRNLALARASGCILAVTDDDCFPDPGWLAAVAGAFEADSQLAAVTGPILPPPGDPPDGMCAFSLRLSRGSQLFSRRVVPWHVGSGANFAAKVDWLRRLGGWDERLGVGTRGQSAEDCDIIDRLLVAGGSIRYDADAAMHHEWQPLMRRGATRWSYGYGIGALCGLRLAARDRFGLTMLGSYLRRHFRVLLRELARFNWGEAWQRLTAIIAVVPGLVHGFRADKARSLAS
jgi:GT2 family glycosyltransferase